LSSSGHSVHRNVCSANKVGINFISDKRFGLADIYSEFWRQIVGVSVTSSICTAYFCGLSITGCGYTGEEEAVDVCEENRPWMYGRGTGCGCREVNRLWMYVRGKGCGCTGSEHVVDVCQGTGCGCRGGEQAVDVREVNRLWMYVGEEAVDECEGSRPWMYGKGSGCECKGVEQVVDVCEGNRRWMYGRGTGCGFRGGNRLWM
jgi:hypothetical protein